MKKQQGKYEFEFIGCSSFLHLVVVRHRSGIAILCPAIPFAEGALLLEVRPLHLHLLPPVAVGDTGSVCSRRHASGPGAQPTGRSADSRASAGASSPG